jgi:dTDP-4-amino-4,6-dideoxygalactose transaminase
MSPDLIDRCNSFHNCGRSCGNFKGDGSFTRGGNFRMTQFQATLLLQQIDKLVRETARRRESADLLQAELPKIPGISVTRLPANSRGVWHLYPFRYDSRQFHGLSREAFIRAVSAEGVPLHGVYREQYFDGLLDEAIKSRGYQRLFGAQRLKAYRESFQDLKGNRETCNTTVGMSQSVLLADRTSIQHIVEAVAKVQAHSAALAARGKG